MEFREARVIFQNVSYGFIEKEYVAIHLEISQSGAFLSLSNIVAAGREQAGADSISRLIARPREHVPEPQRLIACAGDDVLPVG